MNTESHGVGAGPRDDYELIGAVLFWVLFGTLAALCAVVVVVSLAQGVY